MPPWEECARHLENWGQSWCSFLQRLWKAAHLLPEEGLVTSALNTSVAELLTDVLPEALAEPLIGLAAGGVGLSEGMELIRNSSTVFVSHLEAAMFLGSEMLRFGTRRVGRAVFHGESASAGWEDGLMHRADVLLWANSHHGGPQAPLVAEVGVANAQVPYRLLSVNPGLRWVGVDPYEGLLREDGSWEAGREAGDRAFAGAQAYLKPWLGQRARLLRARSTEVEVSALGHEAFDLIFVDALHTEEAALEDLATWAPRVRPGGVLAGHDYNLNYPGVVEAAHASLPGGATLHLGPNDVYWWQMPE